MKRQDIINLAISGAALAVSIITFTWGEIKSSHDASIANRRHISSAYYLGKNSYDTFLLINSGGAKAEIAEVVLAQDVAAPIYAQDLNLGSAYTKFRIALNTVKSDYVAQTFDALDSAIKTAAGEVGSKAVAAYHIGWKTEVMVMAIKLKEIIPASPRFSELYSKARNSAVTDLGTLGVSVTLPTTVANASEFLRALEKVNTAVSNLEP